MPFRYWHLPAGAKFAPLPVLPSSASAPSVGRETRRALTCPPWQAGDGAPRGEQTGEITGIVIFCTVWYDRQETELEKDVFAMRSFYQWIARALEGGQPVVLVSILSASGSTPRGAGTMMAVSAGGETAGTVGGGALEFDAQKTAARLLQEPHDLLQTFRLSSGDAAGLGMVCGGDTTLQFEYLAPDGPGAAVFRELALADRGSVDTWLIRRMRGETVEAMGVADRSGVRLCAAPPDWERLLENRPVLTEDGWFSIPAVRAGRVYIFGGGHVSQALVQAAALVGFRTVVYDDRPEFTAPERFPQAERTVCAPFSQVLQRISLTRDDYAVVMTRGHQADTEILAQILRSGCRYIGCIGSRRKLALCREALLAQGFAAEEYDAVHAPIGLKIGAEMPEEIAVSIAAELIAVRAGLPDKHG